MICWTKEGRFYHLVREIAHPFRAACVGIFVKYASADVRWAGERQPCPRCFQVKSIKR